MINNVLKKLSALIVCAAIITGSLSAAAPFTAQADAFSDQIDKGSLTVTQSFLDNFTGGEIKAELPKEKSFYGKVYKTSRDTAENITLAKGLGYAEKLIYFGKRGTTKVLNYIGRKGIEKYGKYANMKAPYKFRKGKMTKQYSEFLRGKFNLKQSKMLAGKQATPFSFGKTIGNGVNIGVGLYGFKNMMDNPTIGFKSPFLEFTGNAIRGIGNTATVASGIVDYIPCVRTFKPAVDALADVFLISDILFNNEFTVEITNDIYDALHEYNEENGRKGPLSYVLAVTDFIDDSKNLIDLTLQEGINNGADWLDYWIYGIEGDENEKYLEELKKKCKGNTFQGNGVGVYKPNIYLYPVDDTQVSVTFERAELLTVTDPPYENGWLAEAHHDGTLEVNGQSFGYLFYESLTDPNDYQTDEGFVIPADTREAEFNRILTEYGLNDTEIRDFCKFWCEKLDEGCDYAMYPQTDDTLDKTMPLDISPAPDSKLRIWFAFVKNGTPGNTPDTERFDRTGFTAVEWGGFFLEKD